MTQLGIAIMSYNRPDYLREMLATLADNDLTGCDVHLWQDGPLPDNDPEAINTSMAAFEQTDLPNKVIHESAVNLCCAKHRAQVMPYMAGQYERFICMDNDIILSPYAMTHLRTLLDQYDDDEQIAGVSPGLRLLCAPEEAMRYRDAVTDLLTGHLWCEGYWAHKWARLWPWYEQYLSVLGEQDYRTIVPEQENIKAWNRSISGDERFDGPSSDTALIRAIHLSGMTRLRLVVNRATGIGDWGLHCRPDILAELGVGHQPIPTWDDEPTIGAFWEWAA